MTTYEVGFRKGKTAKWKEVSDWENREWIYEKEASKISLMKLDVKELERKKWR